MTRQPTRRSARRSIRLGPPRLLTIAGSDSGGGAGIQADLKTFAAHGAYGMSVVTAVTAQNTRAVTAVHPIPVDVVAAQIDAVLGDIGADAVKIGMLASAELVRAVTEGLRRWCEPGLPVVLDPVMVAKSGDPLLADDAVEALVAELLPLATLVTPNLPEARRMTGLPVATREERIAAARALAGPSGGEGRAGPVVLLKGGHGEGSEVEDLLVTHGARSGVPDDEIRSFRNPRIETRSTHGTGCTLSSAIAARLGRGDALADAVEGAIGYLRGAMAAAYPLGSDPATGHGPLDHLFGLFREPTEDR